MSASPDIETLLYSLTMEDRAHTKIPFCGTQGMQEKWKGSHECTGVSCRRQLHMVFTWAQAFSFLLVIPNALSCVLPPIILFFPTNCSDFYPDILRRFFVCIWTHLCLCLSVYVSLSIFFNWLVLFQFNRQVEVTTIIELWWVLKLLLGK